MFIAICRPSPVLKGVPRSFTVSHSGPRYRARISAFDSKLPAAMMTASA